MEIKQVFNAALNIVDVGLERMYSWAFGDIDVYVGLSPERYGNPRIRRRKRLSGTVDIGSLVLATRDQLQDEGWPQSRVAGYLAAMIDEQFESSFSRELRAIIDGDTTEVPGYTGFQLERLKAEWPILFNFIEEKVKTEDRPHLLH